MSVGTPIIEINSLFKQKVYNPWMPNAHSEISDQTVHRLLIGLRLSQLASLFLMHLHFESCPESNKVHCFVHLGVKGILFSRYSPSTVLHIGVQNLYKRCEISNV